MLSGIRILDTTRLLPGPYATWLLAGMGADVVKVEQPVRGDYIRHNWPRRSGVSTVFHLYNQGKRSVALDLKTDEGRAAFLDLAATSDVVLDGNRPGVMDRLGCGHEACRARRADVVFCAITGFGQAGPYRDRVGHDINYLSLAGVLSGLVGTDGRPISPRLTIADMAGGGLMAVVGVLGALLGAQRNGTGRFVDVSMTDSVLSMQGLRIAEELLPGDARPDQQAAAEGDDWENGVYDTADGRYISLDPYENRFKDTLWTVIEAELDLTRPDRSSGRDRVRAALAEAIKQRPRDRWDELLATTEVCYAPVLDLEDLPVDANVVARGLLGDGMDAASDSPGLGFPIGFSPAAAGAEAGSPELGAHTTDLLQEAGWSDERLDAAVSCGAVAGRPVAPPV